MKAAEFFAAAAQLPTGNLVDVTGGGGLTVVAPHPDDESLGCGGLIAEACASGKPVRLIVVSDGVGSHPNSKIYPSHRLRALREEETRSAAAALGLAASAISFLRLPDRHVPYEGPDADAARDAIIRLAQEIEAGAICVTWEHDPHCDHAACAALVAATTEIYTLSLLDALPIWGVTLAPEEEVGSAPKGFRFEVGRHAAAKSKAIAEHRSQTTDLIHDDPDGFRLSPAMIARLTGDYEIFMEMERAPARHRHSLPAAYFENLYALDPDPWSFGSSAYEHNKYRATLNALPRNRYRSTLEVGCSIGILTQQLAARTDTLLAIDVAANALKDAKRRCVVLGNVRFEVARVPEQWPTGRFDLIVLSEVVYYLDRSDVIALAERIRTSIIPGGDIVLVHWLGETDYPLSGGEATELFTASTAAWAQALASRTPTGEYRLDVLRARGKL